MPLLGCIWILMKKYETPWNLGCLGDCDAFYKNAANHLRAT